MRNMLIVFTCYVLGLSGTVAFAQTKHALHLDQSFIEDRLQQSAKQIKLLAAATPADKFPQNFEQGKHKFSIPPGGVQVSILAPSCCCRKLREMRN